MDSVISGVLLFIYMALMKVSCEFIFKRMDQKGFSYEVCLVPCYMLVSATSCLISAFSFKFPGKLFITFTMHISLILLSLLICLRLLKNINGRWYSSILSRIKR